MLGKYNSFWLFFRILITPSISSYQITILLLSLLLLCNNASAAITIRVRGDTEFKRITKILKNVHNVTSVARTHSIPVFTLNDLLVN